MSGLFAVEFADVDRSCIRKEKSCGFNISGYARTEPLADHKLSTNRGHLFTFVAPINLWVSCLSKGSNYVNVDTS